MGMVRREDTLLGGGGVRSLFIKVCCTEPASVPPSASNVIHPSFSSSLFSTHPNVPPSLSLIVSVMLSLPLSIVSAFVFINRVKVLIDSEATHKGRCSYCRF